MTDYGHELLFGTFTTPVAQLAMHAVELALVADRAGLVGGDAGAKERGNRDGGDDADDRNDDQELDERKAFLILLH